MLKQLKQNLSQVDWELEQLKAETDKTSSVQYWETASIPTTNRSVGSVTNSALNTERSGINSARINTERYQDVSFSNSMSELQQWKRKLINQNVGERVAHGIDDSISSYFKKKKELQQQKEESKHLKLFGASGNNSVTNSSLKLSQNSNQKSKKKTRPTSSKYIFVNGNRINTLPITSSLSNPTSDIPDTSTQYITQNREQQIESTKDHILLEYLSTVVTPIPQQKEVTNFVTIEEEHLQQEKPSHYPITHVSNRIEDYNDQYNGSQTTKQYLEKTFKMKYISELTDKPFIKNELAPISNSLKRLRPTSARSFNKDYQPMTTTTTTMREKRSASANSIHNNSLYQHFTSHHVLDLVKKLKSTFDFPTVQQTPKRKQVKPEVKIANQFKTFQMEEHRLHK